MNQQRSLPRIATTMAVIVLSALALTACASTKLSYDGKGVTVKSAQQAKSCRLLGNTRVSVNAHLAKALPDGKIKDMLQIEARNFAGRIGGDTVVEKGAISEGRQVYAIYSCKN